MPDQLRLLSLDGGGVRGLSSLYILRNLMEKINPSPEAEETPKPCDYFDMIGGTSTGGLIAIMLGRLEMSVDQCIKALRGDLKSRFDAKRLEKAIMKILQSVGMDENTLLSSPNAKCKVFVCAASQNNETTILRSYHSPRDNRRLGYVKIWEACRATSAAQGFFDPISIPPGRHSELFTDGGIRANNPVKELWGQALDLWATDTSSSPADQLRQKLKCLISIGTGRPDLTSYSTSVRDVVKILTKIATDTEAVAEAFMRENPELLRDNLYFRFNVERGLKGIGLDECNRLGEITSATGAYIESQAVFTSMQGCAAAIALKHLPQAVSNPSTAKTISNKPTADSTVVLLGAQRPPTKSTLQFAVPFRLEGAVRTDKFVSRPGDSNRIAEVLLQEDCARTRIFVLHGMGGIGKTQLAIHFAHDHKDNFSSVFWLQAQTEDTLQQSLVKCAKRIPKDQISAKSRRGSPINHDEQQIIVDEVLEWFSQEDNNNWLIIFDNVDLDHRSAGDRQRGAFNVMDYIPSSYGSVLITTRLETLAQVGGGRSNEEVTTVNYETSKKIFEEWYGQSLVDDDHIRGLLGPRRLAGLPLALAQSAVYMRQNKGMSLAEYLRRFDSMWAHVMGDPGDRPLYDYHGAVGVTWALAMEQVREKSAEAAMLAGIWAFLDDRDFTFEMFRDLPGQLPEVGLTPEERLEWSCDWPPRWLFELGKNEGRFFQYLQLLQSYRLATADASTGTPSGHGARYAMHPLVHRWAMNMQTPEQKANALHMALWIFVGLKTTPRQQLYLDSTLSGLVTPHLSSCLQLIVEDKNRDLQAAAFSHLPSLVALRDIVTYRGSELEDAIALAELLLIDNGQPRCIPMWIRYTVVATLGETHLHNTGKREKARSMLSQAQQLLSDMPATIKDAVLKDTVLKGTVETTSLNIAQSKLRTNPDEAQRLFQELIDRADEATLAALEARLDIARLYQRQNNLLAAEPYAREARTLYNKHFRHNEDERLMGEFGLARLNLMKIIAARPVIPQEWLLETRQISLDAFQKCRKVYSEDNVCTHGASIYVTLTYIVSGQLDDAEATIDHAASSEEVLRYDLLSTGIRLCLKLIFLLYVQQNSFGDAVAMSVSRLRSFVAKDGGEVEVAESMEFDNSKGLADNEGRFGAEKKDETYYSSYYNSSQYRYVKLE
ncbi:hypothetical protein CC79DRAFT_1391001 [Sarocladium strictum]